MSPRPALCPANRITPTLCPPTDSSQDERKSAAVSFLREVQLPRDDLYLPTNPDCRVLAVIPESAAPMQV